MIVLIPLFFATVLTGMSGCKKATDMVDRDSSSPSLLPLPCVKDTGEVELLPEEPPPPGASSEFTTDFSRHSIPYSEILSGGPSKDGIPALDSPRFVTPSEANKWLNPKEPVIFIRIGDDVKAYPLQILMWHEIVNDEAGGVPVTITFCPLCNTAIAFERQLDDRILDFGTTGRLRFSNLIMYDRQTETWWQQGGGNAIAGTYTGRCLTPLPASIISWSDFRKNYPEGNVLSRETGFQRSYGQNPYAGYDNIDESPFLYRGPEINGKLPPMARVLAIDLHNETAAYPYQTLEEEGVINDRVGDEAIVVFWNAGTASALDATIIADGKDVGAATAYRRTMNGKQLDFTMEDGLIRDEQTSSVWNIFGEATEGELRGKRLESIPAFNHFWFSWSVFRPDTRVYRK